MHWRAPALSSSHTLVHPAQSPIAAQAPYSLPQSTPHTHLQLRLLGHCILLQAAHHHSNLLITLCRQLAAQRRLPPLHLPPRTLAGRRPPRLLRQVARVGM